MGIGQLSDSGSGIRNWEGIMTPKLQTRPKHLDVRKGYEYVRGERESEQLPQDLESIVEDVKKLERAKYELDTIRATLIVNFGPEGESGIKCGVTIANASERSSIALLMEVLEGLFEKAMKKV